jgi:hypothetical protein
LADSSGGSAQARRISACAALTGSKIQPPSARQQGGKKTQEEEFFCEASEEDAQPASSGFQTARFIGFSDRPPHVACGYGAAGRCACHRTPKQPPGTCDCLTEWQPERTDPAPPGGTGVHLLSYADHRVAARVPFFLEEAEACGWFGTVTVASPASMPRKFREQHAGYCHRTDRGGGHSIWKPPRDSAGIGNTA